MYQLDFGNFFIHATTIVVTLGELSLQQFSYRILN